MDMIEIIKKFKELLDYYTATNDIEGIQAFKSLILYLNN